MNALVLYSTAVHEEQTEQCSGRIKKLNSFRQEDIFVYLLKPPGWHGLCWIGLGTS